MARSNRNYERTSRSARGKGVSNRAAESRKLALEDANATVVEVFPKLCHALVDGETRLRLCAYRRAKMFDKDKDALRERSPVAVGDRIKVQLMGSTDGVVEGVAERRNRLIRSAPDRERVIHVLATNLDLLVIVAAARDPEFTPGIVDRFLIASQAENIPVILVVNKTDLLDSATSGPWALYERLGVTVLPVSVKRDEGVEALRERIVGRTAVLCGHSGVGKTSLLRSLLSRDVGKVGEVNAVTAKGKHTTTSAQMYFGPDASSRWIDTPGVRAFGLEHLSSEDLIRYFPEFGDVDVRDDGTLALTEEELKSHRFARYESYLRILESLREAEESRGEGKY